MNKRGQEGISSSGWIIATVILVIVGIVVVLWYTGVFDSIGTGTNIIKPADIELVAQSCIIAAEGGLTTTYCKDFKKVETLGTEQYINCQYPDVIASIETARQESGFDIPPCGTVKQEAGEFCNKLRNLQPVTYKDDTLVNNIRCGDLLGTTTGTGGVTLVCAEVAGYELLDDRTADCTDPDTLKIFTDFEEADGTNACCVLPAA